MSQHRYIQNFKNIVEKDVGQPFKKWRCRINLEQLRKGIKRAGQGCSYMFLVRLFCYGFRVAFRVAFL